MFQIVTKIIQQDSASANPSYAGTFKPKILNAHLKVGWKLSKNIRLIDWWPSAKLYPTKNIEEMPGNLTCLLFFLFAITIATGTFFLFHTAFSFTKSFLHPQKIDNIRHLEYSPSLKLTSENFCLFRPFYLPFAYKNHQ